MSLRDLFIVTDPAAIDAMLADVRLCTLVTHGPRGLAASQIPMVYLPGSRTLVGHVSRSNPQVGQDGGGEAMAIWVGPNAYVSPSFYPSKKEHGRVAPTWNYESLQVFGTLSWIDDKDWVIANVSALTDRFEAGRDAPWAVSDAPADYVQKLAGGIIGVELKVARVEAKRVFSQQRNPFDRAGVVDGLLGSADPADHVVAMRIKTHGG